MGPTQYPHKFHLVIKNVLKRVYCWYPSFGNGAFPTSINSIHCILNAHTGMISSNFWLFGNLVIGGHCSKVTLFVYLVEIHEIAYVVDAYVSYGRSDDLNGKVTVSYCLNIIVCMISCKYRQRIKFLLLVNYLMSLSCIDYCCLNYLDCIIRKIRCHCKSSACSFR